ncbi:hypothetical protein MNBD_GAMMA04-548 [hydrothermal vent metagenome]|uniref:DUF86 domain-containing protein n=1 Tax=hydrothermal vent metagenome TaxID=652676 RepID=A0A3B0W4N8_9ZZZZ
MTIDNLKDRLNFLIRITLKEIKHLEYSSSQVFNETITSKNIGSLIEDPDFSESLEAFSGRFCRLQDMIGDKLLPAWLLATGELPKTVMDNLMKAEKLEMISSADEWVAIRLLRNQMVHEYIELMDVLADALNRAHQYEPKLKQFAYLLISDLKKLGYE